MTQKLGEDVEKLPFYSRQLLADERRRKILDEKRSEAEKQQNKELQNRPSILPQSKKLVQSRQEFSNDVVTRLSKPKNIQEYDPRQSVDPNTGQYMFKPHINPAPEGSVCI